ncbi:MAG TPA: hypothetical protein VEF89_13370 [Solirubrobacteraceae bacterium]|nr:hypothetical protein [Solirubrobacteraceae bacterium]
MSDPVPHGRHRGKASEAERLLAWRTSQLTAAGFSRREATVLVHTADIDLHAILELVDRRCPPWLAARIAAPLDVELPPAV